MEGAIFVVKRAAVQVVGARIAGGRSQLEDRRGDGRAAHRQTAGIYSPLCPAYSPKIPGPDDAFPARGRSK
jgi:hypothetical protein